MFNIRSLKKDWLKVTSREGSFVADVEGTDHSLLDKESELIVDVPIFRHAMSVDEDREADIVSGDSDRTVGGVRSLSSDFVQLHLHGFFVVEVGYVPEEIHLEVVADLGLEAIVFRGIPS